MRTHWDEALRLAVSVGSGHVAAFDVLRHLAAYPRQNGVAVALREIGPPVLRRGPDRPRRPRTERHRQVVVSRPPEPTG